MAGGIYDRQYKHIVQGVPTVDDLTRNELLARVRQLTDLLA